MMEIMDSCNVRVFSCFSLGRTWGIGMEKGFRAGDGLIGVESW